MLAQAAGEHVADREQVGAAVVVDDALGIAGRARSVVERDGVPLVVGHFPREVGIARRDEILVLDRAQPLARAGEFRIVVVDHQRLHLGERQRLLRQLREFAVGDQHLGVGVVELEGDDGGVEAGIDGVEHRARHRHAVVAFEHRRRVGEHGRHGVAALDAALRQRGREPPRAGVELGVAAAQRAVDDRGLIGKHRGRPLQERQWRERLEVRGVAVEIGVVGGLGQGRIPSPVGQTLAHVPVRGEPVRQRAGNHGRQRHVLLRHDCAQAVRIVRDDAARRPSGSAAPCRRAR